ncbi:hypothetical protein JYK02_26305 [Corallococcus macrosporus]|uniref:CD-NTase-associated protein 12/Pycsar effector protein TIR domain-containing protein n=1 Tax=Corallococcus macrosporus TaxID=35 RepID=A0ABS3DI68_9BACT|nr:hypothetical protein [Corallococcus macrosporus]MBN8231037.1 hypothetical protein [Corallococcus macrosporus]
MNLHPDIKQLIQLRFSNKITENVSLKKSEIVNAGNDARRRGVPNSGMAAAAIAEIETNNILRATTQTLEALSNDALSLAPEELEGFWQEVHATLRELIKQELNQAKLSIINTFRSLEGHSSNTELALNLHFGQQAADQLNRLGQKTREFLISQKLQFPKGSARSFEELANQLLALIYNSTSKSTNHVNLDTSKLAQDPIHKTSQGEIVDALKLLKQKGLIDAQLMMGGNCFARITPSGRLAIEVPKEQQPASGAPTLNMDIPEHFRFLEKHIKTFHEDYAFEKSVFVMMKFPSPNMEEWKVKCLDDIYQAIKDELSRHGLTARRADKTNYSDRRQMWDNICIHMIGCKYGIAVLEDHVGPEFNPNVALEYGFMTALGRNVLLLKEQNFGHVRADILSTIQENFIISEKHVVDSESVKNAVEGWLVDLRIPVKMRR